MREWLRRYYKAANRIRKSDSRPENEVADAPKGRGAKHLRPGKRPMSPRRRRHNIWRGSCRQIAMRRPPVEKSATADSQVRRLQFRFSSLQALVQQVLDPRVELVQLRDHVVLPLLQFFQQTALTFEVRHRWASMGGARWRGRYGHNHRPLDPNDLTRQDESERRACCAKLAGTVPRQPGEGVAIVRVARLDGAAPGQYNRSRIAWLSRAVRIPLALPAQLHGSGEPCYDVWRR